MHARSPPQLPRPGVVGRRDPSPPRVHLERRMSEENRTDAGTLPDILQYEGDIWSVADLFYAASMKQSDFPQYMMPFFALMMLEGRMRNAIATLKAEMGIAGDALPKGFEQLFRTKNCGFNKFIVLEGKTLADVCRNDSSFDQDFAAYLDAFDPDLKKLLGVGCGRDEQKYLNMDGVVAELRAKHILMQVAAKWSQIDLSAYDNSAITTLEEHIKRKWADISASTAGEQYTPDDIISLIAEIVSDKIDKPRNKYIHLYDPTCGGANLLFGVADRLREQSGYKMIATNGSEYNDALYALAAIESRFRDQSRISYGNTLTTVPFAGQTFDVVVANPPYGTSWKGYQKEVENDQKGQFEGGLPSVSDGQLLFLQHILWQLDSKGVAVVVHNGSTLFSGDAGSGESNIRKYIFDHDWVEALIQLPQQEFFNTGITTYLWILNKNKPVERQNLVALIDASKLWSPLKKSKGDKRREMSAADRERIVGALRDFCPSEICKVFDREHFYYNKQKVALTELDDEGRSVAPEDCVSFKAACVVAGDLKLETRDMPPDEAKARLAQIKAIDFTQVENDISTDGDVRYSYKTDTETLQKFLEDELAEVRLGRGRFTFALCPGTTRGNKSIKVTIAPDVTTDYEIIPHHFDAAANDAEIDAFIRKYIFKPCEKLDNTVGVEVNFNKEFYVPEKLDSVEDILKEIRDLEAKLKEVEI